MPTYQYACTACGEGLEAVQRFTDDPLTTCPTCAGQLRKVFSAVGIVFKGSGFYRTDNRSGGSPGTSTSSSSTGSASSTSSEGTDSGTTSTKKEPATAGAATGATPSSPAPAGTSAA